MFGKNFFGKSYLGGNYFGPYVVIIIDGWRETVRFTLNIYEKIRFNLER